MKVKIDNPVLGRITLRLPKNLTREQVELHVEKLVKTRKREIELDLKLATMGPEDLARLDARIRDRRRRSSLALAVALGSLLSV